MVLQVSRVIMPTETHCCLKTKNGKEGSLVHDVGSDRFDMADRSLNPINAIAAPAKNIFDFIFLFFNLFTLISNL